MEKKDLLRTLFACLFCTIYNMATAYGTYYPVIEGVRYQIIHNDKVLSTYVCRYTDIEENKLRYSGTIIIPDSIEYEGMKLKVNGLNPYTFDGCSDLDELIFLGGSKILWDFSIANCGDIKITFPSRISLGYQVLYNTQIPNHIELPIMEDTTIGFFAAMPWLEKYTVSHQTYLLAHESFANCNIKEITFEDCTDADHQLEIGSYCFRDSKIEELKLPKKELLIFNHAFAKHPALKKITFADYPRIRIMGYDPRMTECNNGNLPFFSENPNLAEIICESATPPDVVTEGYDYENQESFDFVPDGFELMDDYSHTFLRVPSGSEGLYAEHTVWGHFVNISDLDGNVYRSTMTEEIETTPKPNTYRIMSDGLSPFTVEIIVPSIVNIYSINGVEIYNDVVDAGVFSYSMPLDVYIISVRPK